MDKTTYKTCSLPPDYSIPTGAFCAYLTFRDVAILNKRLEALIDLAVSSKTQNTAFKSALREEIWLKWLANLDLTLPDQPIGCPKDLDPYLNNPPS